MKKRTFKKYILPIIILILSFAAVIYDNPVCSGYLKNTYYFSDMTGGYCMLSFDEQKYMIGYVRPDGQIITDDSLTMPLKTFSFSGSMLTLISENKASTNIIVYSFPERKSRNVLIKKTDIVSGMICADRAWNIYLVSREFPDCVQEYSIRGTLTKTHNAGRPVKKLFAEGSENNIIAITDTGTVNISHDRLTGKSAPENISEINGNYCISGGRIYSFDIAEGFRLMYDTGYDIVCFTGSEIYAANNSTVYRLSESGSIEAYLDSGKKIDRLSASGNTVAVISGEDITLLDRNAMIKAPAFTEESSNISNPVSKDHEISTPDYSIDLKNYGTNGNIITGIAAGTSFSGFRKSIAYGDNTISAKDIQGNNVSSGTIGTGWEIKFSGNGRSIKYYAAVKGDMNGDGKTGLSDQNIIADYVLGAAEPDDIRKSAADINNDDRITLSDFYSLYQTDISPPEAG